MYLPVAPRAIHYIGLYKPWRSPWDCSAGCRADPLQLFFNSEWYLFYNMFNETATPPAPVSCLSRLAHS
jgi:hypothetical protein